MQVRSQSLIPYGLPADRTACKSPEGEWYLVMHRCMHDGGEPLAPWLDLAQHLKDGDSRSNVSRAADELVGLGLGTVLGTVRHFFDSREFELWACVPEFHARKFGDLSEWCTYKEPLKYVIHAFDGNSEYYRCKEKVPSLNFELTPLSNACATLGVGIETVGTGAGSRRCAVHTLRFGETSMGDGAGLRVFLRHDFVSGLRGPATGAVAETYVDPWSRPVLDARIPHIVGTTSATTAEDDPVDAMLHARRFGLV